jgi:hypothetical protein
MGVGAQRSGTSCWNRLIVDHPGVVPPLIPLNSSGGPLPGTTKKELHYFDPFSDVALEDRDVELYHRFFPRPDGAMTGEWTPSYMVDRWIPPPLQQAAPKAKLLVLLRDPVERYRSAFEMRASRGEGGAFQRYRWTVTLAPGADCAHTAVAATGRRSATCSSTSIAHIS